MFQMRGPLRSRALTYVRQGLVAERGPEFIVDDLRATNEVARILQHKICAICRSPMSRCATGIYGDEIWVCCICGYWGGIGSREWNSHQQPPMRAAIGRYRPLAPLETLTTEVLATHLRRAPSDLTRISPRRAEQFVMDLLAQVLECEVRVVGGTARRRSRRLCRPIRHDPLDRSSQVASGHHEGRECLDCPRSSRHTTSAWSA